MRQAPTPYGPAPWQQTQWDWRAAANFVCGGAGAGVIVFAMLAGGGGADLAIPVLVGLGLVGTGLLCVWLEIGRPLRSLHVFFNPRTSWMSRESVVATLLMPAAAAAAAGIPGCRWLAALLALAYIYCQGRILAAARGIPAWRHPLVVPLVVVTGLAEGAGLWLAIRPQLAANRHWLLVMIGTAIVVRTLVWLAYRRRLDATATARARTALEPVQRWLSWPGSMLLLVPLVATPMSPGSAALAPLLVLAGLLTAGAGAWFKFVLVTRAGFNQGFALRHLPIRGVASPGRH